MTSTDKLDDLLAKIDSAKFHVDNLFHNAQGFWQANISPRFQVTGRAVASEWGRGSHPVEALERAYNEAVKTYGVGKPKPYVDPLS